MSHIFQICPIAFASHGDNVPYDIFSFKITGHQSITWANVDPDLCCHMVSLGHNELTMVKILSKHCKMGTWPRILVTSTETRKKQVSERMIVCFSV